MKVTREQLVDALCDLLDGVYRAYEIHANTGLELTRCKEILDIRDSVQDRSN